MTSQLEDVVIGGFDGIMPKLGMVNWDNIHKRVDFVEHWRWTKALFHSGGDTFQKIHNIIELSWKVISYEMCDV